MKEQFIKIYRKVFSVENLADECVKIADEHAISFLDWYGGLSLEKVGGKTTKELLELYKNPPA